MDAINILKQECGIFVKEVIAGSLAAMDGEYMVMYMNHLHGNDIIVTTL